VYSEHGEPPALVMRRGFAGHAAVPAAGGV